eukprot:365566-Chlamydomonas_euryale.AAC.13
MQNSDGIAASTGTRQSFLLRHKNVDRFALWHTVHGSLRADGSRGHHGTGKDGAGEVWDAVRACLGVGCPCMLGCRLSGCALVWTVRACFGVDCLCVIWCGLSVCALVWTVRACLGVSCTWLLQQRAIVGDIHCCANGVERCWAGEGVKSGVAASLVCYQT